MSKRNSLSFTQQTKLVDMMRATFEALNLSEPEFAVKATEALGFPVTTSNVYGARVMLGLPAARDKQREAARQRRADLKEAAAARAVQRATDARAALQTAAKAKPPTVARPTDDAILDLLGAVEKRLAEAERRIAYLEGRSDALADAAPRHVNGHARL